MGAQQVSSQKDYEDVALQEGSQPCLPLQSSPSSFVLLSSKHTGRQAYRLHRRCPLLTCAAPIRTASLESVFRKSPHPFQNDTRPCPRWPLLADIPDSLLVKPVCSSSTLFWRVKSADKEPTATGILEKSEVRRRVSAHSCCCFKGKIKKASCQILR